MYPRTGFQLLLAAIFALLVTGLFATRSSPTWADTISLRNGMQVQGQVGKVAKILQNPLSAKSDPEASTPVVFVDDSLRRVFMPARQIRADGYAVGNVAQEKMRIEKQVAQNGKRIGIVGPVIKITPFDKFGNRSYTMNGPQGGVTVIQGITEVTPIYCKVEGLVTSQPYIWDMRIATNSLPRDILSTVLRRSINPKDPDQRLRLVRLYTQAERFEDARQELIEIIADFPMLAEFKKQEKDLYQLTAVRLLREIEFRRDAGQFVLANEMLNNFPTDEGLSNETLVRVRELKQEFDDQIMLGVRSVNMLQPLLAKIEGMGVRVKLTPAVAEIGKELNVHTLPRMADFLRLGDDEKMTAEQKVALALSGWLLGSGEATDNLAVALSAFEVRDLVRQYLRSKQPAERESILQKLNSLEGGSPANVAKILANMKPPLDPPQKKNADDDPPGYYEVRIPGAADQAEFVYHVQVPPQYDGYRRYPCVVTLSSAGLPAKAQLGWWTGAYNPELKQHLGQATRNGYIVIAPEWVGDAQRRYEYSAREHAAVLSSLRDAFRRFSIDSDRVFLSGHSAGGDAAWDIGLAHPDLWAGVIPIVATAAKFVERYTENGKFTPLYFVCGELDGDKLSRNGVQFNRYLSEVGYDVMITDYQGRGHENFQEELPRIFDWMGLHRRDFFPKKWQCTSMRGGDNFFWFAEFSDFPRKAMVVPANWPPPRNTTPASLSGKILDNGVSFDASGAKTTIWLSPEFVDFGRKVTINGRSTNIKPTLEALLEDVRTRADRQHPFWARVAP